jgi:hypothetical protein
MPRLSTDGHMRAAQYIWRLSAMYVQHGALSTRFQNDINASLLLYGVTPNVNYYHASQQSTDH